MRLSSPALPVLAVGCRDFRPQDLSRRGSLASGDGQETGTSRSARWYALQSLPGHPREAFCVEGVDLAALHGRPPSKFQGPNLRQGSYHRLGDHGHAA